MIYDLLAPFYDEANRDVDYVRWADFFEKIMKKECKARPQLILDLGCGTGRMTLELARRGYDMTGVDASEEMLNVARDAAEREHRQNDILLLCQDMTEFELYGTVDVAVSCLDCLNHLTEPRDLDRCLSLVHNYLIPDGLFLFDINGRDKFARVYGEETYTAVTDDAFCIWENRYRKERGLCDFYITVFREGGDGRYDRYDDMQRERVYTVKNMKKHLEKAGFSVIGVYRDFDFSEGDDTCDRIYFAARCIKNPISGANT